MLQQKTLSDKSAQQGLVLLEALIAILIFSFAIIGIIGLQAAMIKNTAESKYRGDASYLANQTIGIMWTNPLLLDPNVPPALTANVFSYPSNSLGLMPNIGNFLPNGTSIVTPLGNFQYQVTITWQTPGEQPHTFTTLATIAGNR